MSLNRLSQQTHLFNNDVSENAVQGLGFANFFAEEILIDRPVIYGLKGWAGFLAWVVFIIVVASSPVPTSAYSDLSHDTNLVCRAY